MRGFLGISAVRRHAVALVERTHHFAQTLNAAALVHFLRLSSRRADRAYSKFLAGRCVDRAVAVARDQDRIAILGTLAERDHEMLAMPQCADERRIPVQPLIKVRRIDPEPVGPLHELQVGRKHAPERPVHPAGVAIAIGSICAASRSGSATGLGIDRRAGIEEPVQMNDEVAHVRIIYRRLRLGLPGRVRARIVREDSHDVELGKIPEIRAVERLEFTPEYEVRQLRLGGLCHGAFSKSCGRKLIGSFRSGIWTAVLGFRSVTPPSAFASVSIKAGPAIAIASCLGVGRL